MQKLFVLGDSISIHYGPHLQRMLAGRFEYDRKREPGQTVKDLVGPIGANGGGSHQVLDFLSEHKDTIDCDILLLNCGLHDLRIDCETQVQQAPIEVYERNLRQIIQLTQEMETQVVWVHTTPVDDERHNSSGVKVERYDRDVVYYNGVADAIMEKNRIPVIDLYTFTKSLGDDVYCDHVHFTEEIRTLQAAFIAGHLCRLLQENLEVSFQ